LGISGLYAQTGGIFRIGRKASTGVALNEKHMFVGNSGAPPILGCFDAKNTCEKLCWFATAYGNHVKAVLRHPI
jgi:hypothetical protein